MLCQDPHVWSCMHVLFGNVVLIHGRLIPCFFSMDEWRFMCFITFHSPRPAGTFWKWPQRALERKSSWSAASAPAIRAHSSLSRRRSLMRKFATDLRSISQCEAQLNLQTALGACLPVMIRVVPTLLHDDTLVSFRQRMLSPQRRRRFEPSWSQEVHPACYNPGKFIQINYHTPRTRKDQLPIVHVQIPCQWNKVSSRGGIERLLCYVLKKSQKMLW